MGDYSRNGKNRVEVNAADHDFHPEAKVTPVGLLLPQRDELALYAVTSKVTSDCLVDILCQWWDSNKARFPLVKTLLLNLDNGPESHSRRTQFLARLVEFVAETGLWLQLAYYPPYHSKYNPIERCWGRLEQHWNGDLLDSVAAVVAFARTMQWNGKRPDRRIDYQNIQDRRSVKAEGDESFGNKSAPPSRTGEMVCRNLPRHHKRLERFKL